MTFFGLFKKKQIEEREENKIILENELSKWILNKKKKHKEKEEEFLKPIKKRISQLIDELKLEITALENFDFEKKKVDSRVKFILKENIKNYVGFLEKIIERLSEIKKREKIVEKINFVFEDFNKKSNMTYEKITFMVGKEMQATKESIRKFLKDLEGILKENKKDFEEFKIVEILGKDVKNLDEVKEEKSKFLEDLNKDIENLKLIGEKIKVKEKKLKELVESDKYKLEEKKKKELDNEKHNLEKETNLLHELINFKGLTNFYHSFEKEMSLVKNYKDNFKLALKFDGLEKLLKLLNGAKLNNGKILELIDKINNKEKEILETCFEDFGFNNLQKDIRRIESEMELIESEKQIKEKRLKSFKEKIGELREEIKNNLGKIDVDFVFE